MADQGIYDPLVSPKKGLAVEHWLDHRPPNETWGNSGQLMKLHVRFAPIMLKKSVLGAGSMASECADAP